MSWSSSLKASQSPYVTVHLAVVALGKTRSIIHPHPLRTQSPKRILPERICPKGRAARGLPSRLSALVIHPHGLMNRFPLLLLRLCGLHIGLPRVPRDLGAQLSIALPAGSFQFARFGGGLDRAALFHHVAAIAEAAPGRQGRDLRGGCMHKKW